MCGVFGASEEGIETEHFLGLMKHRGPDSRGVMSSRGWTLGHLRLSIVGLDPNSNQPFSKDGSTVVFNGEIYNHIELKQRFFPTEVFRSGSDTELLISMLNLLGQDALAHLNGMFAFAWLGPSGDLLLVRDRFGVKPLYFSSVKGVFYFSSEIKPLLTLQEKVELDEECLKVFLEKRATDYAGKSGYKGISAVMPGHTVRVSSSGAFTIANWYQGQSGTKNPGKRVVQHRDQEHSFHAEELLVESLRLRCRADVPVSIALSGGVDSSTLYVLMKERLGLDIQPFVYRKSQKGGDESEIAVSLAKRYGDAPIVVEESPNYAAKNFERTLAELEYPIWDLSSVAFRAFYDAISSEGYKVVIEGHGADELLGGYAYMAEAALRELFSSGHLLRASRLLGLSVRMADSSFESGGLGQQALRYGKNFLRYLLVRRESGFQQVLDDAFGFRILPVVLRTFDRMSMASSVESRMPYLDYRFVEFAKELPLEAKITSRGSKHVLRQILRRYGASDVAEIKFKTGFGADIDALMDFAAFREKVDSFAELAPAEVRDWALRNQEAGAKLTARLTELERIQLASMIGFFESEMVRS